MLPAAGLIQAGDSDRMWTVVPTGCDRPVDETLPTAVERIVKEIRPSKVVLFGSYAYGDPTPGSDVACFHAQQCAEKYLKAILITRQVAFSRTHELLLLNDQCERTGILLGLDAKGLNTLSDHAVKVRYPGADPTPEAAREALAIAKTVRSFVQAYLGVK